MHWTGRIVWTVATYSLNVPPTAILLTSDKVHFHLTGCVNKQNFQYWAGANPHELHKRPFHSERVWCCRRIWCFKALLFRRHGQQCNNHYIWHLLVTLKCWKISYNNSWMSLLRMSRTFGSNKMGPLCTPHKEQSITWGSSFLGTSSLTMAIFLGRHGHPILRHAISSFGAIWKEKYTNIVHVIWLSWRWQFRKKSSR